MRFYPNRKINIIGALFIILSLRLSYWQWERHVEKRADIRTLEQRLETPPVPLRSLIGHGTEWSEMIHRRVTVAGAYDYRHEMVLRNRRHDRMPGVFVLTPLRITGTNDTVLVNRGFAPLPLSDSDARKTISRPAEGSFTGLIKAPSLRRPFAPADPETGGDLPWVDAWLRVDLARMQRQLPYPLLPIYLEIMTTGSTAETTGAIVQGASGRDELFVPSERIYSMVQAPENLDPARYPIPVFDTVIPPGRHLGYVFEWAMIALLATLICLVLQLRPSRSARKGDRMSER